MHQHSRQHSHATHPISLEIYQHMIKDLQEHSLRKEQVYHLQIDSLKDKLKEKEELISEMSRRLAESNRSFSQEDQSMEDFEVEAYDQHQQNMEKSAFTVKKKQAASQPSRMSLPPHHESIEEQTRCLKVELNDLFRAKQAEAEHLNRAIDELKNQLVDYQTEKIQLVDSNQQLCSENQRIFSQLQQLTNVCNSLRQINNHQAHQLEQYQIQNQKLAQKSRQFEGRVKFLQDSVNTNLHSQRQRQAEYENKKSQCEELLQTNTCLLEEIHSLRKDKETKREHSEKQHRLIIHYEKKNEENQREIRRLEGQLFNLGGEMENARQLICKQGEDLRQIQQHYEGLLHEKTQSIRVLKLKFGQKIHEMGQKYGCLVRQLTGQLRQLANTLRQQVQSLTHSFSSTMLQAATTFHGRSVTSHCTNSNISLFNREQMLEFELEQLRKQLLSLKKQNFEIKYENKKLVDRKKAAQLKRQELEAEIKKLKEVKSTKILPPPQQDEHIEERHETEDADYRQTYLSKLKLEEMGNKTVQNKDSKSRRSSRRDSLNDQRILQEINDMRRRIKNVREECLIKKS